jgi:hypothetical protein
VDSRDVVEPNRKGQKRLPEGILFNSKEKAGQQEQDDRDANDQSDDLFL